MTMELTISIFIGGILKGKKTLRTPCLIGRSKEAGLTVAHPSMSRKHCELYEDGGTLYLRDNSSLNGTLFDGEYIEDPIPLEFGDEFTVGELVFRVTEPEKSPVPEQQQLAEQPTEAIEVAPDDREGEGGPDEKPGLATVIETPGIPKDEILSLEKKPVEEKRKKPKFSPKDVRIEIK